MESIPVQERAKRLAIFLFSLLAYVVGLGGLIYFILFIGGWAFLPRHVNSGGAEHLGNALAINIGLVVLFGLQHSVMARPAFKQRLTKIIPKAAERSTYVLFSGGMMLMICLFWQPMAGSLWHVQHPVARTVLVAGYVFGWFFAVLASFVINHFELFGLQQAFRHLVNKPERTPTFTERFLYRIVRHPLQLGVLIGLWSTPTMTVTHLVLAAALTLYIFVGLYFEEKELTKSLGKAYEDYKKRVPKIIPIPTRIYSQIHLSGDVRGDGLETAVFYPVNYQLDNTPYQNKPGNPNKS